MSFMRGPVFTAAGRALLARALTGETLKFTKMEMGDGSRGSASIENMTALVHTVASVPISGMRHSGNFAVVSGTFSNADLAEGFNWNEIGLFAADPDNPDDRTKDILYCYQDADGNAENIPASDSELITKRVSIAAIISNATNVTAVFAAATSAADIPFDNSGTELDADNLQDAIAEIVLKMQDMDAGPHAHTHATDGDDPITPEMIGAAAEDHSHNPEDIGAAPTTHGHAASDITAGTFAGAVIANSSGQTPGTYLVRNQKLSATEETPTVNGAICWLYE